MVTGASTADVAVVLVDVTKGATTQSRRHAFIASLLGIPHIIVVVNKMDLVGYDVAAYDRVVADVSVFAGKLTIQDVSFVPVSALEGDNVVSSSPRMPWYQGGPLLHRLETVKAGRPPEHHRLPLSGSTRRQDARIPRLRGTATSGSLADGAEIVVLPSGIETRLRSIETFDGPRSHVHGGDAVVLTTADEVDISRGDMIVPGGTGPPSPAVSTLTSAGWHRRRWRAARRISYSIRRSRFAPSSSASTTGWTSIRFTERLPMRSR